MSEEIPLPPEPDEPEWLPADDDGAPLEPVGESLRERSERIERVVSTARTRHIAAPREGGFRRLGPAEFDPRGRHVPCGHGKCRAAVGSPCEHPTRGAVLGFVHPSRLEAETEWFRSTRVTG